MKKNVIRALSLFKKLTFNCRYTFEYFSFIQSEKCSNFIERPDHETKLEIITLKTLNQHRYHPQAEYKFNVVRNKKLKNQFIPPCNHIPI